MKRSLSPSARLRWHILAGKSTQGGGVAYLLLSTAEQNDARERELAGESRPGVRMEAVRAEPGRAPQKLRFLMALGRFSMQSESGSATYPPLPGEPVLLSWRWFCGRVSQQCPGQGTLARLRRRR